MIVNNFFQIFIGILSVVILVGCSAFPDDRVLDVVTSSSDSSNVQEETPSASMTEETPSASMTEEISSVSMTEEISSASMTEE